MQKQSMNPYLPSWEYVPDGEPYVFGDRVYIYGSHDQYNGHVFCLGDYVCWSAPVDNLADFRYEGVIYKKTQDPLNQEGKMCLYAPDVTKGSDGRYYLYYVLDKVSVVSVAVADEPAGPYSFYGYVQDKDGNRLGEREGDEPQFDPGVLTQGDVTYLYTGFCAPEDTGRHGAMVTVLGADMLTIMENPRFVLPSKPYSMGSGFEEHEFFEAPSIRERNGVYYLIYSSTVMHELCYAVSNHPLGEFTYGGVIISNCDIGIQKDKPKDMPVAAGANNHGSIIPILDDWYIFYHRHTNNTWYCRQGCAEKIDFEQEKIPQVEMTSCGLNRKPLCGMGEYPSYIACNFFMEKPEIYVGNPDQPFIMQEGRDGDTEPSYITNIKDGATIGYKYFQMEKLQEIHIFVRGYAKGSFEIRIQWDGEVLGEIPVDYTNVWEEYKTKVSIPDGVHALYFKFKGQGMADFQKFYLV